MLVGGFSYLSNLIYSNLINSGMFDTVLGHNYPKNSFLTMFKRSVSGLMDYC